MFLSNFIPVTRMPIEISILKYYMEDQELLNELIAQNQWWKTGKLNIQENITERTLSN